MRTSKHVVRHGQNKKYKWQKPPPPPPPITTINHPTINTKYSSVFLRISVFFDEMIENLSSPILLHVVRIRWLVIKVMTFFP